MIRSHISACAVLLSTALASAGPEPQPFEVIVLSGDSQFSASGTGTYLDAVTLQPRCEFSESLDRVLFAEPYESLNGDRVGYLLEQAFTADLDCEDCPGQPLSVDNRVFAFSDLSRGMQQPNLVGFIELSAELRSTSNCKLGESTSATIKGNGSWRVYISDWWRFAQPSTFGVSIELGPNRFSEVFKLSGEIGAELVGPFMDGFQPDQQFLRHSLYQESGLVDIEYFFRLSQSYPPGIYEIRGFCDAAGRAVAPVLVPTIFKPDFVAALAWNIQPAAPPPPIPIGYAADLDADGDFDIDDMIAWLANPVETNNDGNLDTDPYGNDARTLALFYNTTGQLEDDCNGNRFPDAYDIAVGLALGGDDDLNSDTIPDRCQLVPCPADLDGSGTIDLGDLNRVLASFGIDDGGDANGDGLTHLDDLNIILSNFGQPCPNKG